MYVHPDARLNGFKLVKIPSNAELFQVCKGMPSNDHNGSNGDNWVEPDNLNGVDNLDMFAQEQRELSAEAIRHQRAISEAERAKDDDESKQEESEPATT